MALIEPEDPLAQPTRARLFALLKDSRQSATAEQLARELGLHVNGVRRHLERLERSGVTQRGRVRHGRGRPRDEWAVAAGVEDDGRPSRENPEVVCTLHRGITAGLLDELAPEADLAGWEPRDPEAAGCIAEVVGSGWGQAELGPSVPVE